MKKEENILTNDKTGNLQTNFSEISHIKIIPFEYDFSFLSNNGESGSSELLQKTDDYSQESAETENLQQQQTFQNIKNPGNTLMKQPQMQVLGQSVEMESFWDFDREIGM